MHVTSKLNMELQNPMEISESQLNPFGTACDFITIDKTNY